MGLLEFILLKRKKIELSEVYGNEYAKKVIDTAFFLKKDHMKRFQDRVKTWKRLLFYGVG